MPLENSFQNLIQKLKAFQECIEQRLQWAVTQGRPIGVEKGRRMEEDHVLVTRYDDSSVELLALTREAIATAEEGWQAVSGRIDLASARRALIDCQDQVNRLNQRFFFSMVSCEALDDLGKLGSEEKKWQQWVLGVKDALDNCRHPISEVSEALFELWQGITEHANTPSLSVQAISTGQCIRFFPGKKPQAELNKKIQKEASNG